MTSPCSPIVRGLGRRVWALRRSAGVFFLQALVFLPATSWIAEPWCGRDAEAWYRSDAELTLKLGRSVARWVEANTLESSFSTGSTRFDGEWLFGTYLTAGLGFGQLILAHPELKSELLPRMDACIRHALTPAISRFDRQAWGEEALATLESNDGHVAYLGYLNLLLSLRRNVAPDPEHASLGEAITHSLERRFQRSPGLVLETYPGETYVMDNALAISSIALFHRATDGRKSELVTRWVERCRERWREPKTGLLYQAVSLDGLSPIDAPRGSGTALAAYALGYADPVLARELQRALVRELSGSVLGFTLFREYPRGWHGSGDIDSGPLVLGYSISATGFGLGACRMQRDSECFRRLYATLHLVGAPLERADSWSFVSGGPLANAIMLAMLTAPQTSETRGAS